MSLRAIPTKHGGVEFRSRLEARWAVFFDALGIHWEYEPEGFELGDGTRYLPDFKLTVVLRGGELRDCWVEVKHATASADAFRKLDTFSACLDFNDPARPFTMRLRGAPGDMDARLPYQKHPWGRLFGREIPESEYQAAVAAVRAHRFWDPLPRP